MFLISCFVCLFFGLFVNGLIDWLNFGSKVVLNSWEQKQKNKTKKPNNNNKKTTKKQTSIISLCPSFFENRKKSLYPA